MMNENLLRRIKKQLNEKFYVMKDTWLRDCVEFFVKDKPPHEVTDRHIFEFVESQWQLSDLREISNGCLSSNLVQQTSTILTDTYILQVDKMYDIANPKHKQLCEIRKISNDNLEVMKEEEPAEPKGKRMMQLCLTDGVQDVTAIEHTPVKQITGTLLPGYKVMIIGPIVCRRGIILLEDSKYKEIGGEVDSLLKPNALENVLARALGEPENPDPYNDNKPLRIANQNIQIQNTASNLSNDDILFDDDFEEAVDLEAVTAFEQQHSNQETEAVQERFESICGRQETPRKETTEILEVRFKTRQDIDFESFENWSIDSPRPSRVLPSRMETKKIKENDIVIIDEASTSTHNLCSKPPPAPKICDALSDVLREPITGTMYRTVRGQVKNHSTLMKQGKCWSVTALITDHTSSVEVCFKSEVLEEFLGFTVQEFSQKKKLAKSDPQVKEELRLNLRKAQGEIQNLDALLKLELAQDQMPKVVGITQLTAQQKKDLTKRSTKL